MNYYKIQAYSASKLRAYSLNPFRHDEDNPKVSRPFIFGSEMHAHLLEDKKLEDVKEALTKTEFGIFEQCIESVRKNEFVSNILKSKGVREKELFWREDIDLGDKKAKVQCKAKADLITDNGYLVELKTISSLQTTKKLFFRCLEFRYDLAAAWYLHGCKRNNIDIKKYLFIWIEKSWPFECAVFYAGEAFLHGGEHGDEYGRLGWRQLLPELHFKPKKSRFDDFNKLEVL